MIWRRFCVVTSYLIVWSESHGVGLGVVVSQHIKYATTVQP